MNATLGGTPVTIHHGPDKPPFPAGGLFGLDVESTYLTDMEQFDPEFVVRLAQAATKDEAWVFDLADPAQKVTAAFILDDVRNSWCSHSPMDVISAWRAFDADITARNVDTLILATEADPDKEEGRDLKTLATKYGMPELEAGEKALHDRFMEMWVAQGGKRNAKRADIQAYGWANIPADDPVYVLYAGLDAIACRRLAELLVPATQDPPEVLKVDQWLGVRCNRMRLRGMRVDTDALARLYAEADLITSEAKSYAETLTDGVNVNGPKILDWLASHGADWTRWEGARTDKGAPSLAKDNLGLVLDFDLDDTAVGVVREMARQKKSLDLLRKTTDLRNRIVIHDDGIPRIHPVVNPVGASTTARMSSSGPNVQNFSKKDPRMRGLFLPEPGCALVGIDFSQVELRVVAALARETVMIDVIRAGGDLHQLTADLIGELGVPITRDIAKMTNFLIVYGGGPKALHEQGGVPIDIAKRVIDGFRQQYPAITAYSNWLGMEKEAIRTISNRRLPVTRVKGSGDRSGELRTYATVNYAVQSGSRELLARAWMEIDRQFPEIVWLPVHDELILQVPEDQVEEVKVAAQKAMTFDFRGVPIEAEAVELRDEQGVSRWLPTSLAEKWEKERVAA